MRLLAAALLLASCTAGNGTKTSQLNGVLGATNLSTTREDLPTEVERPKENSSPGLEPIAGSVLETKDREHRPLLTSEFYPGTDGDGNILIDDVTVRPDDTLDDLITLNFVNADLREVVSTILGDILGYPFVVDPRVQGTITLRSAAALPRSKVLGVLEQALLINSAAIAVIDGAYKITPLEDAAKAPTVVDRMTLHSGFGVHVIPLRFASPSAVEELISPLIAQGRVLLSDRDRDLLMYVGPAAEARDVAELASLFDIDRMSGVSFGLYPLSNADPKTVIVELERVFDHSTGAVGRRETEFLAIERLNAILAIVRRKDELQQVDEWIRRLDRAVPGNKRQLYVYYVQNGSAGDLANVLGQVLNVHPSANGNERPSTNVAPGLTPIELQSPAVGSAEKTDDSSIDEVAALDNTSGNLEHQLSVPTPTNVKPDRRSAYGVQRAPGEGRGLQIVASERNNALVIHASAAEYEIIEAALSKLDIVPLQVLIEATIAEVTLNDSLRYGVEWFLSQGKSELTLSTLASGAVVPTFPGFSYVLDSTDARVVLNALSRITDVNVISAPQLLVLDNETAVLKVGDQVPVVKKTAVAITDPNAPVVSEVEYRDTGVILKIEPRVNAGGLVVLNILQEVSDVTATTTSGIDSPTIQQRRISSTVAVHSGETVALGGLIRDSKTKATFGVPILKDVPLLGNLFGTTSDEVRRTELLVLLKPRVISNRSDARIVTDTLRGRLTSRLPSP